MSDPRRGAGEYPDPRSATTGRQRAIEPRKESASEIRRETDELAELLPKAEVIQHFVKVISAELLKSVEQRVGLRVQTEFEAQKSAELTMAERRADKAEKSIADIQKKAEKSVQDADAKARARGLWALASAVASMAMLAALVMTIKYLRAIIADDIEAATGSAFEERTESIETKAQAAEGRIARVEKSIEGMETSMKDVQGGMAKLLARLPDPEDEEAAPKKKGARALMQSPVLVDPWMAVVLLVSILFTFGLMLFLLVQVGLALFRRVTTRNDVEIDNMRQRLHRHGNLIVRHGERIATCEDKVGIEVKEDPPEDVWVPRKQTGSTLQG